MTFLTLFLATNGGKKFHNPRELQESARECKIALEPPDPFRSPKEHSSTRAGRAWLNIYNLLGNFLENCFSWVYCNMQEISWELYMCPRVPGCEGSALREVIPGFAQTLHIWTRHLFRKAQVKNSAFYSHWLLWYGGPRARENILLITYNISA